MMAGSWTWIAVAAFLRDCPNNPAEQQQILEAITQNARAYAGGLPDFLATRVTRQFLDHTGTGHGWQQTNTVEQQLSYVQHKEIYSAALINGKPGESPGGLTTAGEFGALFEAIFSPNTVADFRWKGCQQIRGVPMDVFAYRETKAPTLVGVELPPPAQKRNLIPQPSHALANVPFHGLIYANRADHQVMRVTAEAELPRDFPLREARRQIDYGWTLVGSRQFLLPQSVEVRSKFRGMLLRNEVDFLLYRKFSAESTLKIDK